MNQLQRLKIKQLRQKHQLSQKELANKAGVSRQTIFLLETGQSDPSLSLALKLANVFACQIDDLFSVLDRELDLVNQSNSTNFIKGGHMTDLIPSHPFRGLSDLHREIDRLFEDSIMSLPRFSNKTMAMPAINVQEMSDRYLVQAAVPGYSEDEIEIEVGKDYITISGQKNQETNEQKRGYLRREFAYGSFGRSIGFATPINEDAVKADLNDGTLTISLPKLEPIKPKVKKIKVERKK